MDHRTTGLTAHFFGRIHTLAKRTFDAFEQLAGVGGGHVEVDDAFDAQREAEDQTNQHERHEGGATLDEYFFTVWWKLKTSRVSTGSAATGSSMATGAAAESTAAESVSADMVQPSQWLCLLAVTACGAANITSPAIARRADKFFMTN